MKESDVSTRKIKKYKSPSSRRRNLRRLQLYLTKMNRNSNTEAITPSVGMNPSLDTNEDFVCPSCYMTFSSRRNLLTHERRKHKDVICQLDGSEDLCDDKAICTWCGLDLTEESKNCWVHLTRKCVSDIMKKNKWRM